MGWLPKFPSVGGGDGSGGGGGGGGKNGDDGGGGGWDGCDGEGTAHTLMPGGLIQWLPTEQILPTLITLNKYQHY